MLQSLQMHGEQLAVAKALSARELPDHHTVTIGNDHLLWLRYHPLPEFAHPFLCRS